MTAEALCREIGVPLLIIDVARMLAADLPVDLALPLVFREATLQRACLYWDRYDLLTTDDKNVEAYRQMILEELESRPDVAFLGSQVACDLVGRSRDKPVLKIELPVSPFSIRRQLWQVHLDGHFPLAPDVDLDALANKFRFTGGQIRDALTAARNLAVGRAAEEKQITMHDLYQACRTQSNQRLNALARKIQPRFILEDIVLPRDQMTQLREITNYVKYRHIVFGEWNF
jgi:hypothetical protein